ncbi:hypothetical protein ACPA9J_34700 [Pseudomonas aeruginosa]
MNASGALSAQHGQSDGRIAGPIPAQCPPAALRGQASALARLACDAGAARRTMTPARRRRRPAQPSHPARRRGPHWRLARRGRCLPGNPWQQFAQLPARRRQRGGR